MAKNERKAGHVNKDGRPKKAYLTRDVADHIAASMTDKHGRPFAGYKCRSCDYYHVGSFNRKQKPAIDAAAAKTRLATFVETMYRSLFFGQKQ